MAVFFVDVFAHRAAQPFQPRGQVCATGHHQRYGVADVVVGLAEEGAVALQADLSGQRLADDRDAEQRLPFAGGGGLQLVEETHGLASFWSSSRVSR
ncbi:hypothetical protein D3C84_1039840 [compost metagenome]